MKVVAIIPVREFKNTKLRLSIVLQERERALLTEGLLFHVLRALEKSSVHATVIVASDPEEVSRLAKNLHSTILVIEENEHHGGVNKAMEQGIAYAQSKISNIEAFMLIPSDLPLLNSDEIENAISLLTTKDLVLAHSSKKDGTSLILYKLGKGEIPLHYDDDSYRKHMKEAKERGISFSVLDEEVFTFDVDLPADLQKLKRRFRAGSIEVLSEKLKSES